jgi:hypothetical protein
MLTKNSPLTDAAASEALSGNSLEDQTREGTIEDCRSSNPSKSKEAIAEVLREGTIEDCRSSDVTKKTKPSEDIVRGA